VGTGIGVLATATTSSGLPMQVFDINAATNVAEVMLDFSHHASGPDDGFGQSITFSAATTTSTRIANTLTSKWLESTDANHTSQFTISGVDNAVSGNIVSFHGNKSTLFHGRSQYAKGANVAASIIHHNRQYTD
jgi:hypothetical protein